MSSIEALPAVQYKSLRSWLMKWDPYLSDIRERGGDFDQDKSAQAGHPPVQLKLKIEALRLFNKDQYGDLLDRIVERDVSLVEMRGRAADAFDAQIARDAAAGKLDGLHTMAKHAVRGGTLRRINEVLRHK